MSRLTGLSRRGVPLLLAAGDVAATVAVFGLAIALRATLLERLAGLDPFTPVRSYASLWPALPLVVLVRAVLGLYPGYGRTPPEELRLQSLATLVVAVFVVAGGALFRFSEDYSRVVLVLALTLMFVTLPMLRAGLKALMAGTPAYGLQVWVVGRGERCAELIDILKRNRAIGLRMVGHSAVPPDEPVRAGACLVVTEGLDGALPELLDGLTARFGRVWLVPDLLDVASVWVRPRDLQGHLTLELRNNLLEPANRLLKRASDVVGVALVALPALLVGLGVALWIRSDSAGPVLLRQRRVGRGGRVFTVFKFRTMRCEAASLLDAHLAADREARREWRATRKLRDDPRVTRPGRVLRRLSLDELPQLLNVFRGEMSLVGPRPIMDDELAWYGTRAHLYTQVLPGLTGLFQVSGRNDLSYDERVRLDAYYVRNWSIWLDAVIVARTVPAVVSARGAY